MGTAQEIAIYDATVNGYIDLPNRTLLLCLGANRQDKSTLLSFKCIPVIGTHFSPGDHVHVEVQEFEWEDGSIEVSYRIRKVQDAVD